MTMAAKAFSVRLPEEVRDELAYLSEATHRSQSSLAIEMLTEQIHAKSRKMKAIQAAKQDIKSGVFHSGEQVLDWMESWGTENEKASPEPDLFENTEL
ncbi:CopG family ribbon-helix-helix protein [Magnetococcus sp. PR-3]|uniref:CopG family ribbon-helix-helix protein n=1 Tax=Magnetococcus sp. PR-3 TaxID=3120355 RepID=UPI002FCDF581